MAIHIGKIILAHVESVGGNKSEFARRIGVTPQNVYSVFRRPSINTHLLLRICRVLGYNFFQYYMTTEPYLVADGEIQTYASAFEIEKETAALRNEKDLLVQENSYLNMLNDLLRGNDEKQADTGEPKPTPKKPTPKKTTPKKTTPKKIAPKGIRAKKKPK